MSSEKTKDRGPYQYNCQHCESYWQSQLHYWKEFQGLIEYVKLYCPKCKRTKGRSW